MADITMCKGDGCLIKMSCHRYTAQEDKHGQSYFAETPEQYYGDCNYYIENEKIKWNEIVIL